MEGIATFIGHQRSVKTGRKAKSKSLVMLTDMREHARVDRRRQGYMVACFGNGSHYTEEGSCVHVSEIAAAATPWYRSRMWFLPFGDKDNAPMRASEGRR